MQRKQGGAALIVALLLLVIVAFVGLAGIGRSVLQSRASSNQYDREIAFQSAEAALRVAAAPFLPGKTPTIDRDCQNSSGSGAGPCGPNPFADSTFPTANIHDVAEGTTAGTFTPGKLAPMQPQYVIEDLGTSPDTNANVGFGNTANSRNYGAQGNESMAHYYRITARSCNPTNSACKGRAIVVLQSIIKQD